MKTAPLRVAKFILFSCVSCGLIALYYYGVDLKGTPAPKSNLEYTARRSNSSSLNLISAGRKPARFISSPEKTLPGNEGANHREAAFISQMERIRKVSPQANQLVSDVIQYLKHDQNHGFSVENLPVNEKGVYLLKQDYLDSLVRDPAFREKWRSFLLLIDRDREEQERKTAQRSSS